MNSTDSAYLLARNEALQSIVLPFDQLETPSLINDYKIINTNYENWVGLSDCAIIKYDNFLIVVSKEEYEQAYLDNKLKATKLGKLIYE